MIEWGVIRRIVAQKVNRVTYDEVFVQIETLDGASVVIGQLDDGFDDFVQTIGQKFPSIEPGWIAKVDAREPDQSFTVLYEIAQ